MSARPLRGIERSAVEALIVATGVNASSTELDAIARAVGRMQSATESVLHSLAFDETVERFYSLLENDAAERAER